MIPSGARADVPSGRLQLLFRGLSTAAILLLLLLLDPGAAAAQETGRVAGTVRSAQSMEGLEGAQVMIQGTQIGSLTDADGRYDIRGVPAGNQTVVVRLIGYGRTTRQVRVVAGQTATADFELEQQALALERIVVTGQAGQARRREVGNAISEIDMTQVEGSPVNMEGLMQGRSAGLVIQQTAGSAGAGSTIRLRGNTSVTQSNQPLIYIDGVRMRSEGYPKNVPPVGYSGRSANVSPSPLNDLSPADIDRIEIIKGAAATTLYGTEASAGVIQIFTKSGQSGAPQWSIGVEGSMDHVLAFGPDVPFPEETKVPGSYRTIAGDASHFGMDPWLRNSLGAETTGSVRGGMQDISYFLSGSWITDDAPMPNDHTGAGSVRGNFGWDALPNLHVQWNTSYITRNIQQTPSGNNAHGLTLQVYRGERNYVGTAQKVAIDSILDYDIDNGIDRVTSGVTFRWQPTTDISHRFTAGYDGSFVELRQVRPFGFTLAPQGKMANSKFTNEILTLDYAGSFTFEPAGDLSNTFSVGGQYIINDETTLTGYAENFGGPGLPTLESGGLTLSFEDRIREDNAGFFFQDRLGWRDRLFITAGVRFDGNSSFGEGITFDALETYPKLSLSYVVSDEGWWPESLGTWKLRGAWGMAGRSPGAFDKVRTWSPLAGRFGQEPGFLPQNKGNAELKPEKTSEFEVGADGSLFDQRLEAEFTWYRARTFNALFPVRQIPSEGNWGSQAENVGELVNTGIELTLNYQALRSEDWQLELGGSLSTNFSEVTDLGKATSFQIGDSGFIKEGHPVPVVIGWKVTNPDARAEPEFVRDTLGPNVPQWVIQPNARVQTPGGVVLSALGEFQLDYFIEDGATENGIVRSVRWPTCFDEFAMIDAGQRDQLTALQRASCLETSTRFDFFIHDASFFKLRNVSARFPLTKLVQSLWPRARRASLTFSARNAVRSLLGDMEVFDPEMAGQVGQLTRGVINVGEEGDLNLQRTFSEHIPPPATYTVSFQIGF